MTEEFKIGHVYRHRDNLDVDWLSLIFSVDKGDELFVRLQPIYRPSHVALKGKPVDYAEFYKINKDQLKLWSDVTSEYEGDNDAA